MKEGNRMLKNILEKEFNLVYIKNPNGSYTVIAYNSERKIERTGEEIEELLEEILNVINK